MSPYSREDRSEASPLHRIIPIVVLIGIFAYVVAWLSQGSDPWVFFQIGAACGLLIYLLTFVDILLGLAILVCCVGFSPEITLGDVRHLRLEDFLIPALLMAWLLRSGHQRQPLARLRIGTPALAYLSALVLSTAIGLTAGTTTLTGALELIGKYLEYFALFLLIVNNVRTEQEFKALVLFSVLMGAMSALINSGDVLSSPLESKVHGPLGETANIYGGYLLLNLSIAIGLFLHASTASGRVAASVAILLLGVPLLHTLSRTSSASLALALFFFGLLKERRVLLMLLLFGALVPMIASEIVMNRLGTILGIATGAEPPSWVARVSAWEDAVPRVLQTSPLFGFGAGSVRRGDVDCEYVRAIMDGGILGLGLLVWFLGRVLRIAFARYDGIPSPGFHKSYAAGFLIAFFALCIHSVAATSFTAIRTAEMFMILAGLYVCQLNRLPEWTAPPPPTPAPVPPVRPEHRFV